ncbi:putative transcriptional regulator YheO [Pararhizobium capsulatum DSM 1112]|uniref:Transcriptional regulator YheO n=1 Tax=Pararhizobium capsulatum DSM 1112 TaxID=1121113 RepID=A0ABU0BY83_9HYPH|nr:PAS domain-containing protein [Pararhizobium capsulatum]MDQ0323223.1 putative transcriptional regulator YheO [Pararhizobium capsulatum DSM 1112]
MAIERTRPSTHAERRLVIDALASVVAGLAKCFGANTEIVLHDLAKPEESIVAIANGKLSGRTIGSSIISGPFGDVGLKKLIAGDMNEANDPLTIVDGYKTRTRTGLELESTSILLRDSEGTAYAAICVNADRSKMRELKAMILELANEPEQEQAADVAEGGALSVEEIVTEIIDTSIKATGKTVLQMQKEEKMEAVRNMNVRGLFMIRSSVDVAAASLGISRFTVYSYLEQLKSVPR